MSAEQSRQGVILCQHREYTEFCIQTPTSRCRIEHSCFWETKSIC